jgi:hypothetical protein
MDVTVLKGWPFDLRGGITPTGGGDGPGPCPG